MAASGPCWGHVVVPPDPKVFKTPLRFYWRALFLSPATNIFELTASTRIPLLNAGADLIVITRENFQNMVQHRRLQELMHWLEKPSVDRCPDELSGAAAKLPHLSPILCALISFSRIVTRSSWALFCSCILQEFLHVVSTGSSFEPFPS